MAEQQARGGNGGQGGAPRGNATRGGNGGGRGGFDGDRFQKKDDKPKVQIPIIQLPTTKKAVSTTLRSRIQLWHGLPKIGKSTTANDATGGTYFFEFEPGHDHLEHFGTVINSWEEFIGAINALEEARRNRTDLPFANVCIDTAGVAFGLCTRFINTQLGIIHESDAKYGKGSQMIEREFRAQITRLCNLGFGVIMIAHTAEKTRSNGKTGPQKEEWTELAVDLPKKALDVIPPLADLILYFAKEFDENEDRFFHVIKTQRTYALEAGCRYPSGWAPMPETIDMSYAALEEAWNSGAPGGALHKAEMERAKAERERVAREKLGAFAKLFGGVRCKEIVGRSTQGMSVDELEEAVRKLEAAQTSAVSGDEGKASDTPAESPMRVIEGGGERPTTDRETKAREVIAHGETAAKSAPKAARGGRAKAEAEKPADYPSDDEWDEFYFELAQLDQVSSRDEHRSDFLRAMGLDTVHQANRGHLSEYLAGLRSQAGIKVADAYPEDRDEREPELSGTDFGR